ncbi:hypothetical protein HQ576_08725, partial [bacterium]|nr:hypothetical protein [bacterium]
MPPHELQHKLARLRAHLRRIILFTGASRVVLVAVAMLGGALVLDWSVRLEPPGRVLLLASCSIACLYTLWRFVVSPLCVSLADEHLALVIERRFPSLRDRLISTVQLAAAGDPAPLSRDLIDQLTRDTLAESGSMNFETAVTARPAARWGLGAAAVLIFACLFVMQFPSTAAIFSARLFHPLSHVQWPRRTQLTVLAYDKNQRPLVPEGLTLYVPKGEDMQVVVRAARFSGKLWSAPARVAVHYRSAVAGSGRRFLSDTGNASYATYFTTVTDTFSFHATGDDASTPAYEVRVRNRPRVEGLRITLHAPAYTGEPERVIADGSGAIRALGGTRATLAIRTNKPIATAHATTRLLLNDHEAARLATLDGAPTHLRAEFFLEAEHRHYAIALTDVDGLTNSPAATYRLSVSPDRPPAVALPGPGASRKITPRATVPIRIVAKDDYRVVRARLLFRPDKAKQPTAHRFADAAEPTERLVETLDWDLTPLALNEGDVLHVHAEADDSYRVEREGKALGPNTGRSPTYRLTVISEAEMASLIQRRLQEIKLRVDKVAERQARAADASRGLAQDAADAERQTLKAAEREQLRIAAATQRAAGQLAEALGDMQNNKVGNLEDRRRVKQLTNALRPLADKQMPEASRRLATAAQPEATTDQKRQHLADAATRQQRIAAELHAALARFDRWTDVDDLVRVASELLLEQQKLAERTRDLARKLFGKPATDLTADEKGIARSLARAQRGLRDAMKRLEDKMARAAKQLQSTDPAAAKTVEQALSQANADQVRASMNAAATQIEHAKPASALPHHEQSTAGLKRLLDTLNRARSPYLARDLQRLQAAIAEQLKTVRRLLAEEKRQLAETAVGNLRRQLKSLRDAQTATQKATRQATTGAQLQKQAEDQARHGKSAGELKRQLQHLAPQNDAERKPADLAGKKLDAAAAQMQQATQSLGEAKAKPDGDDAAKAAAEQDKALKELAEADRQLARLQKQLAEGKSAAERLDARAKAQQKTQQETQQAAGDMKKSAQEARSMAPTSAKSLENAQQQASRAAEAMSQAKQQLAKAAQAGKPTPKQEGETQKQQQEAVRNLEEARKQLAKTHEQLDLKRREQEIFELE